MNFDLFLALVTFCAVTLITPGPNNILLMASGLNFGARRTQPHLVGVAVGFAFMTLLVGLGVGQLFVAYPTAYTVLKYVGAAYLLYLAWAIANSGQLEPGGVGGGKPLTFLQAAAFQWVNPKAWVMAIGASASYAAVAPFPWNAALMAGLFGVLGFVSSGVWVVFGLSLRRILTSPRAVRTFNWTMAALLVVSLYPVVRDLVS